MVSTEDLINQLGSFWKSKREEAIDKLTRAGVKKPKKIVPALIGAMGNDKERIRENARLVYDRIANRIDIVSVILRSLGHGEFLWKGAGPTTGIGGVAVGKLGDKNVIAAGSLDNKVYIWDDMGTQIWVGEEPESEVRGVAIGKLGKKDVVVGAALNAYVWDKDGNLLWKADDPDFSVIGVAISKLGGVDVVAAGSADSNVYVWDEFGNLLWVVEQAGMT